jgi:hypothetical protein
MKVYVITEPPGVRGIYNTWALMGVRGARYMAVSSPEKAQAILDGPGVILPRGSYAFTDGNSAGGVGVVLVEQGQEGPPSVREIRSSVREVFIEHGPAGLESPTEVDDASRRLRNVLAELAALYLALRTATPGGELTVVHDFEGVSAWTEGRWKAKDPVVAALIDRCGLLIEERGLRISFQQQNSHRSTWAGRDDYVYWNSRADALASEGSSR